MSDRLEDMYTPEELRALIEEADKLVGINVARHPVPRIVGPVEKRNGSESQVKIREDRARAAYQADLDATRKIAIDIGLKRKNESEPTWYWDPEMKDLL